MKASKITIKKKMLPHSQTWTSEKKLVLETRWKTEDTDGGTSASEESDKVRNVLENETTWQNKANSMPECETLRNLD